MPKFSHISDVHIHNLKYHKEQKKVFDKLYKSLKENNVDYNIVTGDIFHVKSNVTPEAYQSAADFLKNLADIAPTHVILGNHDLILSNKNRLDSVTPVVEAINHSNLFFHKHSTECIIDDGNIALNVMSIVDEEEKWIPVSNKERINIGLFHGSISGVVTDQNWVMTHGEIDVDKFADFDYVLLGDIHKANQILDVEGKVRYAGSLCQNNFGETNDKGYLIWDISDKETFSVEHIHIPNPKPFVTVELDNQGKLPKNFSCPKEARIRVVSNTNITSDKIKKAVEQLRKNFFPESISYQNKTNNSTNKITLEDFSGCGNLRDEEVQKSLIRDYLKDYSVSEEMFQEIYALNSKYNREVEANEEVSRNVHWKVSRLKWSNLFNYGENNEIDFTKIQGTVGIFGKNFSGKSSVVDSLLFAIYNNTSKNIRKNLHIINQNKANADCFVEIIVGNKVYTIERTLSKYTKKLRGEVSDEAKTTVDFTCFDQASQEKISLNGVDNNETNKNIRKVFGTIEDFFVTSMSSQMGALSFINEGSTKRKEIIAKFMDLDIFESKFKLAKDESSDVKSYLRRLESKNFDKDLEEAKLAIQQNEFQIEEVKNNIETQETGISVLMQEIAVTEEKVSKIESENIDPDDLKKQIDSIQKSIDNLTKENDQVQNKINSSKDYLLKANNFLQEFDLEDIKNKKQVLTELKNQLISLTANISEKQKVLSIYKNQAKVLDTVPCGKTYLHTCDFIKEANQYLEKIDVVEMALSNDNSSIFSINNNIEKLNESKLDDYLSKHQQVIKRINDEEKSIKDNELSYERNLSKLKTLEVEISLHKDKLSFYELHKEIIDNMRELLKENQDKRGKIEQHMANIKSYQNTLTKLYKEHGSCEQKIETIRNSEEEKSRLQKQYAAYELFMRCMHNNGIAFDLIKNNLPLINQEISKVLSNVVDFEIFFENTDNKLDIFIKHPRYDARPIENGSGAEKTLAAMAIRIALINISNMPKSNLFILDEPGTALDAENMEGFVRILDLVKGYFDVTLLITHIESLKDIVDTTIEISKTKEGYAFINQ